MEQQILKLFKNIIDNCEPSSYGCRIKKILKNCPQLKKQCEEYLKLHPQFDNKISYLIICICQNIKLPECRICGKTISYRKYIASLNHNVKYCSKSCSHDEKALSETNKTRKETCLKIFGKESNFQTKQFKEKTRKTCLQRYGVQCSQRIPENIQKIKQSYLKHYGTDKILNVPEISEKFKQTSRKNNGTDFPAQSEKIKQKIKKTNLEKYNVEYPMQSPDIQSKTRQTNLKKHRHEFATQSEQIKQKTKQTNLKKYQKEFYLQTDEFKERCECSCLKKYGNKYVCCSDYAKNAAMKTSLKKYGLKSFGLSLGWKTIQSFKDYVIPLFEKQDYKGIHHSYKWKCVRCGNIFQQKIYTTKHIERLDCCPRCIKCFPFNHGDSKFQKEVTEFCRNYFNDILENRYRIIPGQKQLDIYIPEIKLAIECNGNWCHDQKFKNRNYHLDKTKACEALGIRLIHIWENEWRENPDKIKEMLQRIFTGNQQFDLNQKELVLDRSKYPISMKIPGFEIVKITQPELVKRDIYFVYDCGYFIFVKINNLK